MSKITLPPLSPQTRSQQRQILQRADPAAYRWIIGVRVKATQGAGFAQSLLWVPAMLPIGYIPVWTAHGDYAPALLQLEIDAHLGEGREVAPFLIPLSATEKLRAYCEVYGYPNQPRFWRCEHCMKTFITSGPVEPYCCAECGMSNNLLNEEELPKSSKH